MSLRIILILLVLHGVAGFAFLSGVSEGFPLDDTWAHMVFARSFAEGAGFSYNPGQPETGVTAPFWTLLLSLPVGLSDVLERHPDVLASLPGVTRQAAEAFDGRPDLAVRILCGLMGLALACVGWQLASRAGRWPAVFTAAALTFDPLLLFDRYSGMELTLFGLLTLMLAEALLDEREQRSGLLAGFATLARPEGLLLLGFGFVWFLRRKHGAWRFLMWGVLCLLPWIAYCLAVSGRPWPATFDTKAVAVLEPRLVLSAMGALFGDTGWGWALPLSMAVGIFSLEGGRHTLGWLVTGLAVVLGLGVLLSRPLEVSAVTGHVPYYWARYAHIVWPLALIVAATGVSALVRTAYAGLRCKPLYAALLIGPFLVVLLTGRQLPAFGPELKQRFSRECAHVEALNVAAGEWIAENTDRRAVVATHDAGAIRFFGDRRTLDIFGNQSHALLAAERRGPEAARQWLLAQKPDVLAVFPALWARNHSPELKDIWADLPPQEGEALMNTAQDYAEFFGLTRRVKTFTVDDPATVPSPLHAHLALFERP